MVAHGIKMLEEENDHLRNTDVLKADYDLEAHFWELREVVEYHKSLTSFVIREHVKYMYLLQNVYPDIAISTDRLGGNILIS